VSERSFTFSDLEIGNSIIIESATILLNPSDCIILTGPNGCGKSTLLKLMACLKIKYIEAGTWNWSIDWNRIGYVEQNVEKCIFSWLSVEKNMKFYSNNLESSVKKLSSDFQEKKGPSGKLSGGMKQRLALIKEMAIGNGLLLLDEPFTNQSETWFPSIIDAINLFRSKEGFVAIVSHNIREFKDLSARIFRFEPSGEEAGIIVYKVNEKMNEEKKK